MSCERVLPEQTSEDEITSDQPNSATTMGADAICIFSGCIMPMMASSGQGSGSERLNAQLLVDSIPALIHTARPDGHLDYFNKPRLE